MTECSQKGRNVYPHPVGSDKASGAGAADELQLGAPSGPRGRTNVDLLCQTFLLNRSAKMKLS